jgi:predicted TIM-barrel fold metal-dependent hydrolase
MSQAAAVRMHNEFPLMGEILDGDGHMYLEPSLFEEIAGEVDGGFVKAFLDKYTNSEEDLAARARNRADLWAVKGISALGSYDAKERVEALDMMGIKAQLLFPNTMTTEQRVNSDAARRVCTRVNDYAIAWTKKTGGRARVVCEINMSDRDWALKELARVIKAGAKAIVIPCAEPPGGVSPAHEMWDPFWAMLEEADVVATIHLGSGGLTAAKDPDPMLPSRGWANAASLKNKPAARSGGEEATSPWFMLVAHVAPEIYLQALVMGKVFERFPRLRFGIIECSANWLGPCVERMDLWVDFMAKVGVKYPMKPSEYVKRNVRVTPFWHENLPLLIERYGLKEAYIFSTDYPHLEGSRDPIGKFRRHVHDIGSEYERPFFVDNAKLLFPGL